MSKGKGQADLDLAAKAFWKHGQIDGWKMTLSNDGSVLSVVYDNGELWYSCHVMKDEAVNNKSTLPHLVAERREMVMSRMAHGV